MPDEQVGLTIAGLYALAGHDGEPTLAADRIVRLIREAADKESAVSIDEMWSVVVERLGGRQALHPDPETDGQIRLSGMATTGEPVDSALSVSVIGRVLCREYLPFASNLPPRDFEIAYGQGNLRPFIQVQDATDYLKPRSPEFPAAAGGPGGPA